MTASKSLAVLCCITLFLNGCTSTGSQSSTEDEGVSEVSEEAAEEEDELNSDLAADELGEGTPASTEVTDLRYVSSRNGGTVVIRTTGAVKYRLREVPAQNQMVLEVANSNLPERLRRPYITQEFNQAISAINAYQDPGSTTSRFVIQMRANERLRVEQQGNEIFLAPESSVSGDSIAVSSEAGEGNYAGNTTSGVRDGLPLNGASLDELNYGGMRFFGKPISIEVRDTPVAEVIAFIAEQSGANLVVADDVKGEVTLKLKQVPWDQALLLIMKSKQLGYVRQGNVLRIAPLATLQAETKAAREVVEQQKLAEPLRVRVIPVSYAKVADLQPQVQNFITPNRGKVVADARTSSLVVTDIIENLERITNLVKALDLPPLQVQIEAKVVEATDNLTQSIGVNWRATGEDMNLRGDLDGIGLRPSFGINQGITTAASNFRGTLAIGTLDLLGSLDATLGMLENENKAKIISSPTIVTMNNETANISQTQQIPIPKQTIINGAQQNTIEFKDVSLALDVTPQITSNSDVIMQVSIKREFTSAQSSSGLDIAINSRNAKTRVMVSNGQTAVIGGIYQSDELQGESGVPLLKDIPVLGWLFKQKNKQNQKNELLLFLTPRILNSAQAPKSSEIN